MASLPSPDDGHQTFTVPPIELTDWVSQAECALALTTVCGRLLALNEQLSKLIPQTVAGPMADPVCVSSLLQDSCGVINARSILESFNCPHSKNCVAQRFELSGHNDILFSVIVFPHVVGGTVEYLVWQFEDIRQAQQLQDYEAHAAKMNVISRLAGGMAHEFNNLLTAILGNLELIRTRPAATIESVLTNIDAAESASLRASCLIDKLRQFSSRNPPHQEAQPLAPIVRRVHRKLAGTAPPNIKILSSIKGDEQSLRALFNADALCDALLKLGLNAIEAIGKDRGCIEIGVCESQCTSGQEPVAQIDVNDTGHGMSLATQARAFEPFFSTKQSSSAPGLGMALAHSLIEEMGGAIRIVGSSEEGSRIRVTLPLAPSSPEVSPVSNAAVTEQSSANSRSSEVAPNRTLAVALVDDDADVRSVGRGLLQHQGHNVTTFLSGADLLVAMDEGARFDLIVLDNSMPATSGQATYVRIRHIDEHVPVVITSGRIPDLATFAPPTMAAPNGFLAKPFTLADMTALLEDCFRS